MAETEIETPPRPDITKDRIMTFTGGVVLPFMRLKCWTDPAPVWCTLVPVEEADHEKETYPREQYFRILHDVQVGTVDELVELYRKQLTRVFNTLALVQPEDKPPLIIPHFGEASLRLQQECFKRNNIDLPGASLPLRVTRKQHEEWLSRRQTKFGEPQPQLSVTEADVLRRLVGTYDTMISPPVAGPEAKQLEAGGYRGNVPTDNPENVQRLIEALTKLKEDAILRNSYRCSKQATSTESRDGSSSEDQGPASDGAGPGGSQEGH